MKKLFTLLFVAGLVLSGCVFGGHRASVDKGYAWLRSKRKAPARINISGTWNAGEWGTARVIQRGRRLSGTIGSYKIKGKVSGRRAYMIMTESRYVYFRAVMRKDDERVIGKYARINEDKWWPIIFKRIGEGRRDREED